MLRYGANRNTILRFGPKTIWRESYMKALNQFGLWYLATLAPAFTVGLLAWSLRPLDPTLGGIVAGVVAVGAMPILAMVMISAKVAFRVETEELLPKWYRRWFEA